MIPTLLDAKTQKGMAIPNAAITNPPSAGPAARPMLKATPLAAVALSRSCLGTSIGIVAPHAGEVRAPPTPSRNVVASRSEGVARFRETRPAKTTDTARIATSTAISRRRESMTSAKAPEGRVNRNNGRLTATCTRDTVIGLASRLVINQPDAVSNIAVPTFETKLAVHITVKARWLNGPHREGAGVSRRRGGGQICAQADLPAPHPSAPGSDLSINRVTPSILHSPDRRWNVRQQHAL